ncbi:MAG: homoserine dehydrogenase [Hyphomonadaceae bacterium]|nr:homoserine dehydrogenase [Hyphomonadaceae bacterium]
MKTLKLGIAGLGHVGCGLIELVERQAGLRLPGEVQITGVSARSRSRKRPVSIEPYKWFDDAAQLAVSDDIDIFVELMGGSDGPAKVAVEAALKAGKPVVTANKALIAEHGQALADIAEGQGIDLLFEAAVAGGVPVVRVLRDSLSGVEIERVAGILNGTCNFLTTTMLETGRPYAEVLEEAQRLGFAEADPTLDVSGMDAAYKIAILSAMAFSASLDFSKVAIHGVDGVGLFDLKLADRLGYRIKLIAEGVLTEDGVICRVAPMALPVSHPLAQVNGSLNTVRIEGAPLGAVTLTGPGAGPGPTASAVMGDIAKLFNPGVRSAFGRAAHHVTRKFISASEEEQSAYFIRARLSDRSGALARLSEALAAHGVSVDQLLQESAGADQASPIAIVTHVSARKQVDAAMAQLSQLDVLVDEARLIRIEAG